MSVSGRIEIPYNIKYNHIMKKTLLIIAAVAALLMGCNKPQSDEQEETFAVSLTVTDIADNCATVRASLTEGTFYGAKLIEKMNLEDVTIDYGNDIQLVNFVEKNGISVELPYENILTDVRVGKDCFTAIIVYDATGRAAVTSTCIWTPVGNPDGWSETNNPGELEEIEW